MFINPYRALSLWGRRPLETVMVINVLDAFQDENNFLKIPQITCDCEVVEDGWSFQFTMYWDDYFDWSFPERKTGNLEIFPADSDFEEEDEISDSNEVSKALQCFDNLYDKVICYVENVLKQRGFTCFNN
jgi:hypothetical protein